MKKAKPAPKKSNNIKTKSNASPLVKSVKKLASGLVKAMSPKAGTKKPQVKVAPKAAPKKEAPVKDAHKKPALAVKAAPKNDSKHDAKHDAKHAPKHDAKHAPKHDAKHDTKYDGKRDKNAKAAPAAVAKGKAAPAVAAVLTKGKGASKGKGSKLTGAALQEHLEKMCRETGCENYSTTKGYCRLDYIKNWKKIKRKEMILKEGKLNQYIEELVSKYPEKYIDVIRQDLSTEVNFNKVIHDLELDESIDDLDYDGDSIDALIGGIKKEAEDFGDDEF